MTAVTSEQFKQHPWLDTRFYAINAFSAGQIKAYEEDPGAMLRACGHAPILLKDLPGNFVECGHA